MIDALLRKKCVPCEGGALPLTLKEANTLLKQTPGWGIRDDGKAIQRQWKFKNFVQAIDFVKRVAEIAEEENHHPDIAISYSRVTLTLWTHAIGGLSENDFIVAAKVNTLNS